MKCNCCGYDENTGEEKFIGIFIRGNDLSTTDNEPCGLYACPKCNVIRYTTDMAYIEMRKNEYKMKNRRRRGTV